VHGEVCAGEGARQGVLAGAVRTERSIAVVHPACSPHPQKNCLLRSGVGRLGHATCPAPPSPPRHRGVGCREAEAGGGRGAAAERAPPAGGGAAAWRGRQVLDRLPEGKWLALGGAPAAGHVGGARDVGQRGCLGVGGALVHRALAPSPTPSHAAPCNHSLRGMLRAPRCCTPTAHPEERRPGPPGFTDPRPLGVSVQLHTHK